MNINILSLLCPLGLLIIGVVAAGLLAIFAYRSGQKKVKRARVIKCKVAEMRDGDVCRVKGRLTARAEPLTSPLTNKPCVYFHFKVEQAYEIKTWTARYNSLSMAAGMGPSERSSESETWHTIVDDVQRIAVAVEDETGRALLDLADAELEGVTAKKEGVIDTSRQDGLTFDLMLQKRYGESTLAARRSGVSAMYARRTEWMREGRELPKATVLEEVIESGVPVHVVGEVEVRDGRPPRFRPVDHPLVIAKKARDAELPTPTNLSMGLWIAAGVVLGATILFSVLLGVAICAGVIPPAGPNGLPPQVRPLGR
ncbi:MAG TPA: hypothetical protein VMS17_16670 [Gemmataceae bacterium]|nr:hypothetical protein [Gemmataceae bacterium]